jgi:hypothetical protein
VVPARSECAVEAKTVYADLTGRSCHWASAPLCVMRGVYVARSLVADQPQGVHVRVINVANDDAAIEKGTHLGYLEEVAVISDEAADHDEPPNGMEHLTSVFNTVDETISETDRDELWQLLQGFSKAFSKNEHDLGRATTVQHTIDIGLSKPIRQALRRQPVHQAAAADEEVQATIDQGIIRPSRSEWSSNLVLVKKKDGSLRCCVDYRQLNERTVKDTYLLPHIDDCLDTLAGAAYFSTFDLRSGYHQVGLHPRDAHKTAFVTRKGVYEFTVMLFRLMQCPCHLPTIDGLHACRIKL